jgi:hypothetical protein
MVMLSDLDRFHLVIDVIDRAGLAQAAHLRQRWSTGGWRRGRGRAARTMTGHPGRTWPH